MTDPNVAQRIEAELARTKASIAASSVSEVETFESRRAKVPPLYRFGTAVDEEVRINLIVTAEELLDFERGGPAPRVVTKFDRVMQPWARAFLAKTPAEQRKTVSGMKP